MISNNEELLTQVLQLPDAERAEIVQRLFESLEADESPLLQGGWTIEQLRAEVQKGLDDLAEGRSTEFNSDEELKAVFEGIKQRGRALLQQPADR